MVTNKRLNDDREAGCFAITPERKYFQVGDTFVKRSLRPKEWQDHPITGETYVPRANKNRLLNEAAALAFVAGKTTVPVPKLHACLEDDGAVYLISEYVEGRGMDKLDDDQKAIVQEELKGYIQQLHALRSQTVGGPSGLVVPPYRVREKTIEDHWVLRPSQSDDYVFCHNDLSQQNIIEDSRYNRLGICGVLARIL